MVRRVPIANLKGPTGKTGPRGLPGVNAVPADEAVAGFILANDSDTRNALREVMPTEAVTSATVERMVVIEDGDPVPTLSDGDILVRYREPGKVFYTNFAGDTVGAVPAGWSPFGAAGPWQVVADAGASGGKGVALVGASGNDRRGLAWDLPSEDPDRKNYEILYRWKCVVAGNGIFVIGRAGANIDNTSTARGVLAGVLDTDAYRQHEFVAGALVNRPPYLAGPFTAGSWYRARVRVEGDKMFTRSWADGSPEPLIWGSTVTLTNAAEGLIGAVMMRPNGTILDWMCVATGGREAVLP